MIGSGTYEEAATLILTCYALSFVIVIMSDSVPTKWRTWTTVHCVALAVPIATLATSILVAIPGLMILGLVIAATSRVKRR